MARNLKFKQGKFPITGVRSLRFDYLFLVEDPDKVRQQQPVRLQPSWEENNLPEDELNFKSLTMEDASLQLNTPADRYNLVYLTFLLHGIGVLMPWNMFITAKSVMFSFFFSNKRMCKKMFFCSILPITSWVMSMWGW